MRVALIIWGHALVYLYRIIRLTTSDDLHKNAPAGKLPVAPDAEAPDGDASTKEVRLQRFLAWAGLGSRRSCEDLIRAGRVAVDGKTVEDLGTRIDPRRQEVRVDFEIVRPQPKRYFLLNKPKGCVCTNRDPGGRTRAIDLVPHDGPRLFTVGRLDENSEGLLLLTNDGELAHKLAHPRFRVPRKYQVQVVGKPTPEVFATLKRGLHFTEGKFRVRDVRRVGAARQQHDPRIVALRRAEPRNPPPARARRAQGHPPRTDHVRSAETGEPDTGKISCAHQL
jgi:23S rRNA pseudouridine2605 synthase